MHAGHKCEEKASADRRHHADRLGNSCPNPRGGDVFRKVIRAAEGGAEVSYDIRLERFGEGDREYTSVRHRHDFEQLRFAAAGRMDLGFGMLEEGDVGYFPANAYYGPQRCDGALILIAQWGDRFITKEQSDAP
jgi:hypothetical protein